MTEKKEKWLPWRQFLNFPVFEEDFWRQGFLPQSGLTVSEDKDRVYVEAHLPGLKPEHIEMTYENGVLWIRGEKEEEEKDKKKKYYRKASSSFSYRVQIPGVIDEKKEPEASYKDGVMKIAFAKVQKTTSKKINIKTK
jgi:HSP20 family protein